MLATDFTCSSIRFSQGVVFKALKGPLKMKSDCLERVKESLTSLDNTVTSKEIAEAATAEHS